MSISLTPAAAEHVRKFLAEEEPASGLRLKVKPTGCSGFMYVVEPAHQVGQEDSVFETEGIRVIVDALSLKMLAGTEVDFGREGLNTGLKFNNPNVTATCGCGESFTV